MTMVCNMCNEGKMIWTPVLYDKNADTVFKISEYDTPEVMTELHAFYADMTKRTDLFKGMRITHVYNCEECPNSQLEYYQPEDAIAYEMVMNCKTRKKIEL